MKQINCEVRITADPEPFLSAAPAVMGTLTALLVVAALVAWWTGPRPPRIPAGVRVAA